MRGDKHDAKRSRHRNENHEADSPPRGRLLSSTQPPAGRETEPPADRVRYFDFDCLGSDGITRRHGWYDTETRRIVQVG